MTTGPKTLHQMSELQGKDTVNIDPKQANLNDLHTPDSASVFQKSVPSQKRDTGQMGHTRFPDYLYNVLPKLLRDSCNVLTNSTEKEVFLVGALGVISGILPNVVGHYDGRYIGTSLYAYVLAGYGVGKGGLEYARQLGAAIHTAKRNDYERAAEQYEELKQQYEKDKKAFARTKSAIATAPKLPTAPPNLMLYVPANSSKTGLYQVMHENAGRLVMFETEGDTLADAVKQDYGNFSDGLRKAFHHEQISYLRRGNGGEYVEIKHPYLSLVLSSTFDQLKTLMPTAENGLFSRFLFYELAGTSEFKNVFDKRKRDYSVHFDAKGLELSRIYDYLNSLTEPLYVDLTPPQQERFLSQFQTWKNQLRQDIGAELDGTVNRLGIICFRVAMLFSVLRAFEYANPSQPILCSDTDFDNALLLVESLRSHALSVWSRLPKTPDLEADEQADIQKAEQKRRCRELSKMGLTVRQIALQVLGSETKHQTVWRWIQPQ